MRLLHAGFWGCAVLAGGALGTALRYALAQIQQMVVAGATGVSAVGAHAVRHSALSILAGLHVDTLVANVVACLLLGLMQALNEKAGSQQHALNAQHTQGTQDVQCSWSSWLLPAMSLGWCGGLSTMSTFAVQSVRDALDGQVLLAGLSIAANLTFGCLAFAMAFTLGSRWYVRKQVRRHAMITACGMLALVVLGVLVAAFTGASATGALVLISLAGGMGALFRALVTQRIHGKLSVCRLGSCSAPDLPLATVIVNLVATAISAMFSGLSVVSTGLCGGLSTFSTAVADAYHCARRYRNALRLPQCLAYGARLLYLLVWQWLLPALVAALMPLLASAAGVHW